MRDQGSGLKIHTEHSEQRLLQNISAGDSAMWGARRPVLRLNTFPSIAVLFEHVTADII